MQMNGYAFGVAPLLKDGWIQTYTGRQFWPLEPRPEDVAIRDIAHSLAHQCRYAGHCTRFYSVAEHSVLVAGFVSKENALAALLHDAAETYLVDVPRPVKALLPNYAGVEERLNRCIAARYRLTFPWPQEVHDIDMRILADERAQLMVEIDVPDYEWGAKLPPLNVHIPCYGPVEAERLFLDTFERLSCQ